MPLRVRVALGPRVEWHERGETDLTVGRGRDAGLQVRHPAVAALHLRLLERRGRVIAADLGTAPRGTVLHGRRIEAPVVLGPTSELDLAGLRLQAHPVAPEDLRPAMLPSGGPVGAELPAGDPAARRFRVHPGSEDGPEEARELVLGRPGAEIERWQHRVGPPPTTAHASRPLAWLQIGDRPALLERVPAGLRLREWLHAFAGGVTASLPARALIVAHLARALDERHERGLLHGAVGPDAVQVARTGYAALLSPGPDPEAPGPGVGAARRSGREPHIDDDRWALVRLAAGPLDLGRFRGMLDVLRAWAGQPSALDPGAVLEALRPDGVDPSPAMLARSVRVAEALLPGPLVVGGRGAASG
jgi:hypothetical protein